MAVARAWKRIETIAKPATMALLFATLALAAGFRSRPLVFFGLGILFSLVGDVFLLFSFQRNSNRWFLAGMGAFLLAQGAYIIALNIPFGGSSPLVETVIAIVLALAAGRLLQPILAGVRARGLPRMVAPVAVYAGAIDLMLLSALLTFLSPAWKPFPSVLVSLGAALFFSSDVLLAWNKFVKPVKNGRLLNMVAYHLGQMALISGAVLQFRR
jgi:uncharacterized membrane protein YhhN